MVWNGTDLATADPATVWDNTGLVPQIFAQWPLRDRENVTLGQPRSHDDGPVWDSVEAVGMRDSVAEPPAGLDTLLAREIFGGTELSGGRWQRLACSRALYRRPIADRVVVMDQGRITEQGTYDDLVHAGGTFADLLRLSQDR